VLNSNQEDLTTCPFGYCKSDVSIVEETPILQPLISWIDDTAMTATTAVVPQQQQQYGQQRAVYRREQGSGTSSTSSDQYSA